MHLPCTYYAPAMHLPCTYCAPAIHPPCPCHVLAAPSARPSAWRECSRLARPSTTRRTTGTRYGVVVVVVVAVAVAAAAAAAVLTPTPSPLPHSRRRASTRGRLRSRALSSRPPTAASSPPSYAPSATAPTGALGLGCGGGGSGAVELGSGGVALHDPCMILSTRHAPCCMCTSALYLTAESSRAARRSCAPRSPPASPAGRRSRAARRSRPRLRLRRGGPRPAQCRRSEGSQHGSQTDCRARQCTRQADGVRANLYTAFIVW